MNEKPLLKWGGMCAFAVAILFAIWRILFLIAEGIPSEMATVSETAATLSGDAYRAGLVVEFISAFIFVVVAYATYDYLRKTSYGKSRAGFGFAMLTIIFWFLMMILAATGKNIALAGGADSDAQLSVILALQGGLIPAFWWFITLYAFLWGLAFVKLDGNNKIAGYMFFINAAAALLSYVFSMFGNVLIANIMGLIVVIAMIIGYIFVGLVLTAEAKKA